MLDPKPVRINGVDDSQFNVLMNLSQEFFKGIHSLGSYSGSNGNNKSI